MYHPSWCACVLTSLQTDIRGGTGPTILNTSQDSLVGRSGVLWKIRNATGIVRE